MDRRELNRDEFGDLKRWVEDDAESDSRPHREMRGELSLALGRACLADGALAEAGRLLEVAEQNVAVAQRTALAEQWVALAKALLRRAESNDDSITAEQALRRAAATDPAHAASALAQFLQRAGRLPEAASVWADAAKAKPNEPSAMLSLARVQERLGCVDQALDTYLRLVDAVPTATSYLTVAARLGELTPRMLPTPSGRHVRIALLGNATLDHLASYLTVECFRAGIRPTLYQAGFDQYTQEILDPHSGLYTFNPDVVICAIHASRVFPRVCADPSTLAASERLQEVAAGLDQLDMLVKTVSERSSAMVLLHNMVSPQHPALGILDWRTELGQTELFGEINRQLAERVRTRYRNVFLVDEDRVQSQTGKAKATDPRLWFTAHMPWSETALLGLSREYLRYLLPYSGLSRKCIVLDLDNTLWGGVIGEDGLAGIQLGADTPGNAFVAFQQELQRLWARGILLAVCSKNNSEDASAVFERHPAMLLRAEHIAAQRVNWSPKPANIRELASELNIGLDSLVFIDDNPIERAAVRAELPEVLVPEWPSDPAAYRTALLELGVLESLAITTEDRNRGRMYAEQRQRREFEATSVSRSLEEFLADLAMEVRIVSLTPSNISRIAQLTTKTNQFNLTTRRYSEADITRLQLHGFDIFAMHVTDRFGDHGLVGLAILGPDEAGVREIDTLLLSCRVMGRQVEAALLRFLAEHARAGGSSFLRGLYVPTPKNAPARDCYARCGFSAVEPGTPAAEVWELDMIQATVAVPQWLSVRVPQPVG